MKTLTEDRQVLHGESAGRLGSTLSVEKAENVESPQIVQTVLVAFYLGCTYARMDDSDRVAARKEVPE